MATIRAYTIIEQSRKLAEILPIESADMFYSDIFIDEKHKYNFHYLETYGFKTFEDTKTRESVHLGFIPCWSLVALLGVLPSATLDSSNDHYYRLHCMEIFTEWHDNPVDACYEMVIKLKERNLL